MSRNIFMVFAASLALAGCDTATKQDAQYDDSRNPFYKQATQDLDNNNPAAAAGDYEAALGANPKLAEAHYQLGHIYGEKLNDPIGSIFHFQQYLKLAPTAEKADEVKALIDKQSQTFAASLPNSPSQNADDYAKLQADNAALKKQVDDATHTITQLQTQLAGKHHHDGGAAAAALAASTPPPPAPVAPAPAATPATPAAPAEVTTTAPAPGAAAAAATAAMATNAVATKGPLKALPLDSTNGPASAAPAIDTANARSYTIVKGDSIWKIAHKMYPGDTKNGMEKIQEANKEILTGKPLKIGQVLVIP